MNSASQPPLPSLDEALAFSVQQIVDRVRSQDLLRQGIEVHKQQLAWFKRPIIGQNSERQIIDGADGQMSLGEAMRPKQSAFLRHVLNALLPAIRDGRQRRNTLWAMKPYRSSTKGTCRSMSSNSPRPRPLDLRRKTSK